MSLKRSLRWSRTGSVVFDLFRLFCHGLVVAIFVSFLGFYVPLGDSMAVIRPELTVILALAGGLAYWLGRTFLPALAAITVLASALSLAPHIWPSDQPARSDIVLHQHNLLWHNDGQAGFAAHVLRHRPDVLTLQEMGGRNLHLLEQFDREYPHHQACTYKGGGVAVMARDLGPWLDGGCDPAYRLAWMRIDTAQGPVTFVSVHLSWPWPMPQFWHIDPYAEALAALPPPRIVGGDFNMVPWAASVRRLAQAAEGAVTPGIAPTYHVRPVWPAFRIDHVIVPDGAEAHAQRLPKLGSDHNGVVARIDLSGLPGPRRSASR